MHILYYIILYITYFILHYIVYCIFYIILYSILHISYFIVLYIVYFILYYILYILYYIILHFDDYECLRKFINTGKEMESKERSVSLTWHYPEYFDLVYTFSYIMRNLTIISEKSQDMHLLLSSRSSYPILRSPLSPLPVAIIQTEWRVICFKDCVTVEFNVAEPPTVIPPRGKLLRKSQNGQPICVISSSEHAVHISGSIVKQSSSTKLKQE